jgi:hypothetical protein
VAVAVVGGAGLAQLGEAVEEVRRVSADEVEVGLEARDRVFGVGERPRRPLFHGRQRAEQFRRVVGEARAAGGKAKVFEDRDGFREHRAEFSEEGGEVLGRRLRGVDQRFDVVEGGAQVDEGRVGLPQGRRQELQALVEGGVLAGDRAEGGVGVGDRAGELGAAFGDGGAQPARADQEAGEELFVGVQIAGEGAGAVEADAEVFEGPVGVFAATGVDAGVALDELSQAAAHRGREGVEELVDVDRGGSRGEAKRGVACQRRIAVRPGADRDVVVGDAGERGRPDRRRRPLVQFLADADDDLGQVVVGQLDAFDRADRLAADQHLVVGNELARVLEEQVVLVFAAAAEDDHGEGNHGNRENRNYRDPHRGDPPALCRTFFLA